MKKLLLASIIILLSTFKIYSQENKDFEMSKIYQMDSTYVKSIIYSNCITWVGRTFKSANNVIQVQDKESGRIIVKCLLTSSPRSVFLGDLSNGTYCMIEISIKDFKYKVSFSQLNIKYWPKTCSNYNGFCGEYFTYQEIISKCNCGDKCQTTYKNSIESEIKYLMTDLFKSVSEKNDF
jgi:hypothetical protein